MSKARNISDVLVSPDFTGTVTADGLTVGFNQNIQLGSDTYPLRISRTGAGALVSTISDGYDLAATRLDFVMREGSANEVTALSITGSGNVGIGSTPAHKLSIFGTGVGNATVQIEGEGGADPYINFLANNTQHWSLGVDDSDSDKFKLSKHSALGTNDYLVVDTSGHLLFGTTGTPNGTSIYGAGFIGGGSGLRTLYSASSTTNGVSLARFYNPNGNVGSIQTSGSSTSYVTSSDYRLKTDVLPMTGATATFMQLKPVNFEWIADGTRVDGFLAHELGEVIPAAATGTHNGMMDEEYEVSPAVLDDEGVETTPAVMATRSVPDYQGIDQSKVVPLLVATLQEALAEIETLKTRLTALEE